MTTYDDQDPEQDAPAWLVWPLRVAALVIVTPLQLLGVARRSIGIALERLGSSLRRGVRAVGRALIACWWALDRGLRAVGRMVGGALRGLGRLLARLVRTGGRLLRGTRWVFRATAPLWRALRRAAVATLPLWRRLGAWLGALVRVVRPAIASARERLLAGGRLVTAAVRLTARSAGRLGVVVLCGLGWSVRQVWRALAWSGRAARAAARLLLWSWVGPLGRALAGPLGTLLGALGRAFAWASVRSWRVLCRLGSWTARLYRATLRPVLRGLDVLRRGAALCRSALARPVAQVRRAAAEARASLRGVGASVRRSLR